MPKEQAKGRDRTKDAQNGSGDSGKNDDKKDNREEISDKIEGWMSEGRGAPLDEEIDHLVYKLYDLTEEEIAIVEESK